jgi:hypothetical protein
MFQLGNLCCSPVLTSLFGFCGLLWFATEAVITIVRADDMIKLFKEENQDGEDQACDAHGLCHVQRKNSSQVL